MAKDESIKKVFILGSGALKIGEAGEFDYSGSQAIKAFKQEGIHTVLLNPNIATIQTSEYLADKVYFLPVTAYFAERVIEKEKPDSILLGFGGQTALNCGIELYSRGILKKHNVKIIGTPISAIINTEDRELFIHELEKINILTPKSRAVTNVDAAMKAADEIGYPVIIRAGFSLGGKGSGVAKNKIELHEMCKMAFSSLKQILVEEYLGGWKEIEYEVVRDCSDNCITVCNMENLDPMGIHTGESIVVAPSQTLTNSEYHKLRQISISVIRQLGIIGECNIQYALDPKSEDYRVIEVNARLSRSSALASKATGYPLAFVAAKLALGYTLTDIQNNITKVTKVCFEPSLDYIAVKIPKWDLQKFRHVTKKIGSEMKSVGEVMSIARGFEEALQKAIRMLDIGKEGISENGMKFKDIKTSLHEPTDKRIFAVASALEQGMTVKEVHSLTNIDNWFLYKIKNITDAKNRIIKQELNPEILRYAKELGFSDRQIANLKSISESEVRELRINNNILPIAKQIDTLAAEYPAKTNYLYMTYNGTEDDVIKEKSSSVIVLGSGPYRIGSSVEFDWCCVNTVNTLRKMKYRTIMINYNPETVSTDYDECDSLYFDELSLERVTDIYEKEKPLGVIVSMGGQIPNNLAMKLQSKGIKILGTAPESIDKAENRHKFSKLLDSLGINQPIWKELTRIEDIEKFANDVGYPVIVRPSYVLSGAAMSVVENKKYLKELLMRAINISREYPVVVSKFIENAKEIEIDAVAKNGEIIVYAISEHVENAGVHSGDATMVLPAQRIYLETSRKIKGTARDIAKALHINGPFNIQFLAKDNEIMVIECNLRVSRSFPFVSKIFKLNFIDLATQIIMGHDIKVPEKSHFELDYVGVKAPQFSYSRLRGADPTSFVEMASTGEVACIGDDFYDALLKAMLSTGFVIPKKRILLSTGSIESKAAFLESTKRLHDMEYEFYATSGTGNFMKANNIPVTILHWPLEEKEPNAITYIKEGKIDLVVNIPKNFHEEELTNDYLIRRTAVDFNVPLLTNLQLAKQFVEAISRYKEEKLGIKSWDEY
jgi:carbamoyl-phosphate synthase large subunit